MESEERKGIYKERAVTGEAVHADLQSYRGMSQPTVSRLKKAKSVALWHAGLQPDALRLPPAEFNSRKTQKTGDGQGIGAENPTSNNLTRPALQSRKPTAEWGLFKRSL